MAKRAKPDDDADWIKLEATQDGGETFFLVGYYKAPGACKKAAKRLSALPDVKFYWEWRAGRVSYARRPMS